MNQQVLAKKKQVIVLIPEISLTYQTGETFYERFGERIAAHINSRRQKGEKSDACERIRAGEADVIIGHGPHCSLDGETWTDYH